MYVKKKKKKKKHCQKDNEAGFKITDVFLNPNNKALPQTDNISSLLSQFLDFLESKILKILENFLTELLINLQQHNITPVYDLRPAKHLKTPKSS